MLKTAYGTGGPSIPKTTFSLQPTAISKALV